VLLLSATRPKAVFTCGSPDRVQNGFVSVSFDRTVLRFFEHSEPINSHFIRSACTENKNINFTIGSRPFVSQRFERSFPRTVHTRFLYGILNDSRNTLGGGVREMREIPVRIQREGVGLSRDVPTTTYIPPAPPPPPPPPPLGVLVVCVHIRYSPAVTRSIRQTSFSLLFCT